MYGIDLSSAAVVKALDPQKGDRILDLCCCPGAKLCYIADLAGTGQKNIIGVDINQNRLNVCKNIISKYKLDDSVELVCADGVEYANGQLFDRVLVDAECTHDGSFKHLLKYLKHMPQSKEESGGDKDQKDEKPQQKMSNRKLKRLKK